MGTMFLGSKGDLGRVSLYLEVVGASIRVCVSYFELCMLCCSSKYPFFIFA